MSTIIYTHAHCATFTLTPLEMLTHLSTAHAASSAATLASHGARGLDNQLVKQRLHTRAIGGTRTYPCVSCRILHATSFDAQQHLETAGVHAAEVAAARASNGAVGVADLIATAWVEAVDEVARPGTVVKNKYTNEVYVNEEQGVLNIAQNAGPAVAPRFGGEIALSMEVSGFSVRDTFPSRVTLGCAVPRATATVDMLAECLEAAWVRRGGATGKVAWALMMREVGATVGGKKLSTDEEVRAWIAGAGAVEQGRMVKE